MIAISEQCTECDGEGVVLVKKGDGYEWPECPECKGTGLHIIFTQPEVE